VTSNSATRRDKNDYQNCVVLFYTKRTDVCDRPRIKEILFLNMIFDGASAIYVLAHGILVRPAPRSGLIPQPVSLAHVRDLWHKRVVRVWVRQQRANRQQNLR
jgi:hypothetical protein